MRSDCLFTAPLVIIKDPRGDLLASDRFRSRSAARTCRVSSLLFIYNGKGNEAGTPFASEIVFRLNFQPHATFRTSNRTPRRRFAADFVLHRSPTCAVCARKKFESNSRVRVRMSRANRRSSQRSSHAIIYTFVDLPYESSVILYQRRAFNLSHFRSERRRVERARARSRDSGYQSERNRRPRFPRARYTSPSSSL